MANKGQPDTGGSQFFIIHQDSLHLDGLHTVFGRVVKGLDVVDRIASVEVDENGRWGKRHRPLEHIVLSGTTVRDAGQTARSTSASPGRAPRLSEAALLAQGTPVRYGWSTTPRRRPTTRGPPWPPPTRPAHASPASPRSTGIP